MPNILGVVFAWDGSNYCMQINYLISQNKEAWLPWPMRLTLLVMTRGFGPRPSPSPVSVIKQNTLPSCSANMWIIYSKLGLWCLVRDFNAITTNILENIFLIFGMSISNICRVHRRIWTGGERAFPKHPNWAEKKEQNLSRGYWPQY